MLDLYYFEIDLLLHRISTKTNFYRYLFAMSQEACNLILTMTHTLFFVIMISSKIYRQRNSGAILFGSVLDWHMTTRARTYTHPIRCAFRWKGKIPSTVCYSIASHVSYSALQREFWLRWRRPMRTGPTPSTYTHLSPTSPLCPLLPPRPPAL